MRGDDEDAALQRNLRQKFGAHAARTHRTTHTRREYNIIKQLVANDVENKRSVKKKKKTSVHN